MKRILFAIAALAVILSPASVLAAEPAGRSAEILEKLAAGFRAMPSYAVSFSVTSGDYHTKGSYSVTGESYYLTLGDAEVFCDGKTRYEVDNRRREVTTTSVDAKSRNILNNPIRAFDFLGSDYSSTLLWERDGQAAVRLVPAVKGASSTTGTITVRVSTAAMRPLALEYDYDGERIAVAIGAVAPLRTPLKAYDKEVVKGYEMIDFR